MEHEYWTNRLLAADGLSAQLRVSKMCESLFGGLQITKPFLPGAVFCHGFRTIDLPRESPRYRNLPRFDRQQTLSYGFSQSGRHVPLWPMPMNPGTGGSMLTLPRL